MTRLLRSLLFVPGNSEKMLRKAAALTQADALVLDLEDAVPPEEKEKARKLVAQALAEDRGGRHVGVRVNGWDTAWALADLRAILPARPGFLMVPKCEYPAAVAQLEGAVRVLADPAPPPELLLTLETARGILAAGELAQASRLVAGLAYGAADLALDTGGEPSLLLGESHYPRLQVVLAATAAGVPALDGACLGQIHDLAALEAEAVQARRMGFQGKLAIHPSHLPVINRVFSPAPDAVAEAREVAAAFADAAAAGRGAVRVRGQMVDAPVAARARRVLALDEEIRRRGG